MTRKSLALGPGLRLPVDFATQTSALLAKKGAGKSNAAIVLVEEFYDIGVPFVYIDPKGDSWGLRSSADGDGKKGLPIPVFGGQHGDIPLEANAGALVADLILGDDDRGYLSCVLDVSEFSYAERDRFLLAFGERLFRRKDQERVLHLVLEEAHEYLPQRVGRSQAQLVGMYQRIVKQGRYKGLGVTLVSQRSAALNKDVLTQADNLFMLRTTSPQDRAAVKAWFDEHADAGDVVRGLPGLADGECWLWSPGHSQDPSHFTWRRRRTFDSGATPKVGQKRVQPRTLADVDLGAVKDAMSETIERAKQEDPKELRKRIGVLDKEIARLNAQSAVLEPVIEYIEVPVISSEVAEALDAVVRKFLDAIGTLNSISGEVTNSATDLVSTLTAAFEGEVSRRTPVKVAPRPQPTAHPAAPSPAPSPPRPRQAPPDSGALTKAERAILGAILQRPASTPAIVGWLAQYSPKSSSFRNALSRLRTLGYVNPGQPLTATDDAEGALPDLRPLPTGDELRVFWLGRLTKAEAAMLEPLLDAYPNSMSKDELADASGYSAASSSFRNALSRLRTLELCERGEPRASDELMSALR